MVLFFLPILFALYGVQRNKCLFVVLMKLNLKLEGWHMEILIERAVDFRHESGEQLFRV